MSVLDMFASALGAFILITIILFPEYNKKHQLEMQVVEQQQQIEADRQEISRQQQQIEAQRQRIAEDQAQIKKMQSELAKTFFIIVIDWGGEPGDDVDLHVTDTRGNEYYYDSNHRKFPGSEGQFLRDSTNGPGIEVWQLPVAQPGTYKIEYNLYRKSESTSSLTVTGSVFARKGRVALPDKTLTVVRSKRQVATVTVGQDGAVNVR